MVIYVNHCDIRKNNIGILVYSLNKLYRLIIMKVLTILFSTVLHITVGYVKTDSVDIDFQSLKQIPGQMHDDPEVYDDVGAQHDIGR